MPKALLFLPTGFEETEAVTTIDVLRRGGVEVCTVALTDEQLVVGAHQISIKADISFNHLVNPLHFDALVLPGGPGTSNYFQSEALCSLIMTFYEHKKILAAICAAPTVLAHLKLLDGKKAVCYPGCESQMNNAQLMTDSVVIDESIVTGKGPGKSAEFAFKVLELLTSLDNVNNIRRDFLM